MEDIDIARLITTLDLAGHQSCLNHGQRPNQQHPLDGFATTCLPKR